MAEQGYFDQVASETGATAATFTRASFRAGAILFVPVLEVALLSLMILGLIALPARLIGRGE